jgi:hypothetical protein
MMREQRKHHRRPADGEVGISWQDGAGNRQFCAARGVDISASGLKVESPSPIDAGTFVYVYGEGLGLHGAARVCDCTPWGAVYRLGLEMVAPGARPSPSPSAPEFKNYYEVMQISPAADEETVHRVYRLLAARYHPDNPQTGDVEQFLLLQEAYEVLGDAAKRSAYDVEYKLRQTGPMPIFELKDFVVGIEAEANRRLGILCLLYNRRRSDPDRPDLSLLDFEQLMTIPREHLTFTVWYLKEKKLLRPGEHAGFEITADGVSFVEAALPSNRLMQKLLRPPMAPVVDVSPAAGPVETSQAKNWEPVSVLAGPRRDGRTIERAAAADAPASRPSA